MSVDEIRRRNPRAILLSGGPASVYAEGAPRMDPEIFAQGIPTLGICYGAQLLAFELGGRVEKTGAGEYGKVSMRTSGDGLFSSQPVDQTAWMSHRDTVVAPPEGARIVAESEHTPVAAFEDDAREAVRRAVPSRGRSHAARPGCAEELPLRARRRRARLDSGRGDPGAGRARSARRSATSAFCARSRAASTPQSQRCSCTRRSVTS